MSSTGFTCSYQHSAVYVANADWDTHVTSAHPQMADATAATAARVATSKPRGFRIPALTALTSHGGLDLQDLGIAERALKTGADTNIGGSSVAKQADIKVIFEVVKRSCFDGVDYNRASFFNTLMSKLFDCDGNAEAAATGSLYLDADAASTAEPKIESWANVWTHISREFKRLHAVITPRSLGRLLATRMYDSLQDAEHPMHAYMASPPSWAQRYTSSEAWVAASSFFTYMKPSSQWTVDERKTYEAHSAAVTSQPQDASESIQYMGIDPDGVKARAMLRNAAKNAMMKSIASGDLQGTMNLRGLLMAPENSAHIYEA